MPLPRREFKVARTICMESPIIRVQHTRVTTRLIVNILTRENGTSTMTAEYRQCRCSQLFLAKHTCYFTNSSLTVLTCNLTPRLVHKQPTCLFETSIQSTKQFISCDFFFSKTTKRKRIVALKKKKNICDVTLTTIMPLFTSSCFFFLKRVHSNDKLMRKRLISRKRTREAAFLFTF